MGSESHRSAGLVSACHPQLSLCVAQQSRGSEMGTAIYKLSGKINFQVKKTHIPGRLPSLPTA